MIRGIGIDIVEIKRLDRAIKRWDKIFLRRVFTEKELASRYEVYKEAYDTTIDYEAKLMADMAQTMIVPAAMAYQEELADTIKSVEAINKTQSKASRKLLKEVTALLEATLENIGKLQTAIVKGDSLKTKAAMAKVRETVDALEGLVPEELWPLPSYAEMLFLL